MRKKTNGGNSGWGEDGKAFGFEWLVPVELRVCFQ